MNTVEINIINSGEMLTSDDIVVFCDTVLQKLKINNWEISLLFCNNKYIKNLNKKFRSINEATDVLSFTQDLVPVDDIIYAGDIVVSLETVKEHSNAFNVSFNEELKRVVIHGILHLKGMDHMTNSKEEKMLQLQENIVKDLSGVVLV